MKILLRLISFAGLLLMLGSSILVFEDKMTKDLYYTLSLVGTVLWFVTIPFWMKRRFHEQG